MIYERSDDNEEVEMVLAHNKNNNILVSQGKPFWRTSLQQIWSDPQDHT